MTLGELFGDAAGERAALEIGALAYDDRAVDAGHALLLRRAASRATATTSRPQAVARGAAALVVERPLGLGVPEVLVDDVRAAMAPLAGALQRRSDARAARRRHHRHERQDDDRVPRARAARGRRRADAGCSARSKSVVGGARAAAVPHDARGDRPAGDVRARCSTPATAPARWRSPRTRSSCGRADAIHFAAAVFTNLTQDHLDFHGDDGGLLRRQAAAVRRRGAAPLRVVNVDDPYGRRLAAELDGARDVRASAADADYARAATRARRRRRRASSRTTPRRRARAALAAARALQRRNALGALAAVARARRRRSTTIAAALPARGAGAGPLRAGRRGPGLRGARRLRAHARLARERAARGARRSRERPRDLPCSACGGDRDRGKRPLMGAIAARAGRRRRS